ncbi:MAG: DUF4128 domain-containing protein [Gammaproteobacteria bacterium]|nr:DUF4128 domain-containing protein [Gammaproteobacteria bacterium]
MTDLVSARREIYIGFRTLWGSTTPMAYDNETFDGQINGEPWIRLSVRHTVSAQDSLGSVGNRRYQREGNVFVQIFTASDSGTKRADELAQQARSILEGTRISTIRFNDVQITEIPSDGLWYNIVVEAAFRYDERK